MSSLLKCLDCCDSAMVGTWAEGLACSASARAYEGCVSCCGAGSHDCSVRVCEGEEEVERVAEGKRDVVECGSDASSGCGGGWCRGWYGD
jgi:hypothetical protein